MMMSVMSSAPFPAVTTLIGPTPIFGHFYIIFWSFWEAHVFLKEAQSQRIKLLYYFIVPWGHLEGVSQTLLGPTMCFHLFLVEWVTFLGGLVHFDKLWLY